MIASEVYQMSVFGNRARHRRNLTRKQREMKHIDVSPLITTFPVTVSPFFVLPTRL